MGEEKLQNIINKLKGLPKFISEEVDNIIEDNAPLIQVSALDNLETGDDQNGKRIEYKKTRKGEKNASGAYSKAYDKYKSNRGGKTNVVDLHLTGEYYRSIKLEKVEKNLFLFTSNDDKAVFLEANYGDVVGIQDPKLQSIVNRKIEPELNKKIEEYLK